VSSVQNSAQTREDDTIALIESWTPYLAAEHLEFLTQDQDLDILGTIAATPQHQQGHNPKEHLVDNPHGPMVAAPPQAHETAGQPPEPSIRHPHVRRAYSPQVGAFKREVSWNAFRRIRNALQRRPTPLVQFGLLRRVASAFSCLLMSPSANPLLNSVLALAIDRASFGS